MTREPLSESPRHSLPALIAAVTEGRILTVEEAEAAFDRIMAGDASPVQMSALLSSLRTRGVAPSEVAGGVRALRRAMVPVPVEGSRTHLVDTCGTGGGSVTTFNISTAAALVAAAAGARVAKHGNRSFTSRSGSADVLEALGVEIQLTPGAMARVLDRTGIVFMFAPLLHPAMRHVGPVRRELAIPTIMNLLGPLTNPAGVRRQVVGVSDVGLLPLVVEALRTLEHERALVAFGTAGMDELSPLGETRIAELRDGEVREFTIEPGEVGLPTAEPREIAGGTPEENALLIRRILGGEETGGARTAAILNAGAAIYVAGLARRLEEGIQRAVEALESGAAEQTLERLAAVSKEEAGAD